MTTAHKYLQHMSPGRFLLAGALGLALTLCGSADRAIAQPSEEPPLAGPRAKARHRMADVEREHAVRGAWAPHGEGRGFLDDDRPLPPELIDSVMELIREKLPERYERLTKLRESNPERFERLIRRMAPMLREYRALREQDAEMAETIINEFRTQEELHKLSQQYRELAGDEARQAEIEKEIAALARSQMEIFQKRMEYRLKDMEARLQRQQEFIQQERARLMEAQANFEQRLADRIEEIKQGKVAPERRPFKRGFHRGERGFGPPDGEASGAPPGMRGDRPMRGPPPPPPPIPPESEEDDEGNGIGEF